MLQPVDRESSVIAGQQFQVSDYPIRQGGDEGALFGDDSLPVIRCTFRKRFETGLSHVLFSCAKSLMLLTG
jgi:hypothetical protein